MPTPQASCAFFCHAMLCKRGLSRHAVSVCPSRSCIVSKRIDIIFKFFSPFHLCHHSSFFYTKRHGNIPTGTPPNGGVECKWGRLKSRNQRLSGVVINNCCSLVCISTLPPAFCLRRVLDDQARSRAIHIHGRP